jgi:hypothetical protein
MLMNDGGCFKGERVALSSSVVAWHSVAKKNCDSGLKLSRLLLQSAAA